jgi:hypothetical protein
MASILARLERELMEAKSRKLKGGIFSRYICLGESHGENLMLLFVDVVHLSVCELQSSHKKTILVAEFWNQTVCMLETWSKVL